MSGSGEEAKGLLSGKDDKGVYGSTSTKPKKPSCCDKYGDCKHAPAKKRPRNTAAIMEWLGDIFETENDRVAACCVTGTCIYRSSQEESSSSSSSILVRSTFHCKGICCAAEVPELLEILEPTNGIQTVKVNVPLKQILVDHNHAVVSATRIVEILAQELFPSTIQYDGGRSHAPKRTQQLVKSVFQTKGICCASETPILRKLLKEHYKHSLVHVDVNVTTKQVSVEHDAALVSKADIARFLTQEGFPSTILREKTIHGTPQQASPKTFQSGWSKFKVDGICCASEIPILKNLLEPKSGIKSVMVHVATKMVYVNHSTKDIGALQIVEALEDFGFDAQIQHDCTKGSIQGDDEKSVLVHSRMSIASEAKESPTMVSDLKKHLQTAFETNTILAFQVIKKSMEIDVLHNPMLITAEGLTVSIAEGTGIETTIGRDGNQEWLWEMAKTTIPPTTQESDSEALGDGNTIETSGVTLRPAVALSGLFWSLSMLANLGGANNLSYCGLLSVAIGMPPIARKAYKTVLRGNIDTNLLMSLAIVGAVLLGQYQEAAAVTFLFSLSEWLEDKATHRANVALQSIVHLKPENANLIHPQTHELLSIPANRVPVGALVAIKAGDKIPCDGVVVEGTSTVDESSLTGESKPIFKCPKSIVSGGTLNNGNTQLVVRTTATSDDSAVSRLIRLVEEAQANRSETEKVVDAFAKIYTPIVVLSALIMCTASWCWGNSVGRNWTYKGLSLLVIACPCALVISTPISYVAGLAATAQHGILVKGGAYLEALGQLKHVCFDKTGTLTAGDFRLLKLLVKETAEASRERVLQYLARMEDRATHPLAKCLVDGIQAEGVKLSKSLVVEDHTFLPGEGIVGSIDGKKIHVGNERLFRRLGLWSSEEEPPFHKEISTWPSMGGTIGFMHIEGDGIVCAYCVADALRSETPEVLSELKKMGLTITMLTGDKKDTALTIGGSIGLHPDQIQSELLPEEKLAFVNDLMETISTPANPLVALFRSNPSFVLMCGDGVNDAPSLAAAHVGVAMGTGTAAALVMETADVTLMDSNLTKLLYSIRMGQKVIRTIRQNVVFSILIKVVVLMLTITDRVGLWAAIASDVGSMILVTLNGMSLLPPNTTTAAAAVRPKDTMELA